MEVECNQAQVKWLEEERSQLLDMAHRKLTRLEELEVLDQTKVTELVWDLEQPKRDQQVQTLRG